MVYTQARLDEALSAFRECKKFLERRGLKTTNLESHLRRKYELRRPPTSTASAPRSRLWAIRDDDSDEEFDPSNDRKARRNIASEPRPAKVQQKHKLSLSGDDSSSSRNRRRKPKGTTWAQGRRQGRSMIVTFKFTKTENLEVLKDLLALKGRGATVMPHEEEINVFNVNSLDSGFTPCSPSAPKGNLLSSEKNQRPAGTIVDPSVGLATPRSSISSIDGLQTNGQTSFIDLSGFADEPTRGLRNRVIPVNLKPPPKKRRSCLTCKEEGNKCSLIKSHPDFAGPCDACEAASLPCRTNEDDEPRMGPVTRMAAESENKKRLAEENENRSGKRRSTGNGNSSSFFSKDEYRDIDRSILRKKDKEEDIINLTNRSHSSGKAGSAESNFKSSLYPLNTGLASSPFDFSNPPDSGCHSFLFTSPIPKSSDLSMGNTLDTAISLSDSTSPPTLPLTPNAVPAFDADPTIRITTSWAHPIGFQHQPKQTGLPCHFCDDFRYGFFGLGSTDVEVAWDHDAKSYLELSAGNVARGHEPTRMCVICSLERLRIRFCGCNAKGKRNAGEIKSNHRLVEVSAWRVNTQNWMKQLQMSKTDSAYSPKPTLPPCHLCWMPAVYKCTTTQGTSKTLQPLQGPELGGCGCGLRVCEPCKKNVDGAGGTWERSKVLGKFGRADAEFLFKNGLLERAWEDYLGGVGLL